VLFASFRPRFSRAERIAVPLKATGIATAIILFSALSGMGILLAAIAVQSVFNGIAGSGIFMHVL
jgi:hypothetical protein